MASINTSSPAFGTRFSLQFDALFQIPTLGPVHEFTTAKAGEQDQ